MARLQLHSSAAGSGYLTVLSGAGTACGTAAQVKAGRDAGGNNAYRRGAGLLAAGTPATYVVPTLVQSTAYTVCLTVDDGTGLSAPATRSFSTLPAASMSGAAWQQVGSALFSQVQAADQSLTFSPEGAPQLSYRDAGSGHTSMRRFSGSPADWQPVGSLGFAQGDWSAGAVAPDGTPYVAYGNQNANVWRFDGTAWQQVGPADFSGAPAVYLTIAIAPDGVPWVAYADYGNSQGATVRRFDSASNAWVAVGSVNLSNSPGPDGVTDLSLAFAPDGAPWLAYVDMDNSYRLSVRSFDGSAWILRGPEGFSGDNASQPSLAFSPDGVPAVAFGDGTLAVSTPLGNLGKASLVSFDGSNWQYVGGGGLSNGAVTHPHLAFGADGAPYVLYRDFPIEFGDSTLRRFDSGSGAWQTLGPRGFAKTTNSVDRSHAIAFSPGGTPYVSYADWENGYQSTVVRYAGAPAAPAAPTDLQPAAGNAQVTIAFTPPLVDGGSPITGYRLVAHPPSGPDVTVTGSGSPITVTGLDNGTAYSFTVYAINAQGETASVPASATPAAAPSAPAIVSAVGADARITVNFSAPASDGGSPVTGYRVTAHPASGPDITVTGTVSPITVTGLSNGTSYTVTVTAINVLGETASPSVMATPATLPGAPGNAHASAGNAQASVTWSAPASNGGAAITGYTVTAVQDATKSCTTTGLGCTVTGLANGTAYNFAVVAHNSQGDSIAALTDVVTPSAPAVPPATAATPIPTLGHAALALLSGLLAVLGLARQRGMAQRARPRR